MADAKTGPISLFEELRRGSTFEAALLTTYNLYFPFLEELVIRRLRSAGCSFVVTLADAGQVAAELAAPRRRPMRAGRRYALLPISARGAFHPKIGLLLGARSARVIVGSHNLTMSGFAANREVTNVIDVKGKQDREGAAAVQEALSFSQAWAETLSDPLRASLDDLAKFAGPYQGPIPTDRSVTLIGSRPDGEPLWERVLPALPATVDRVTVVGPFFDANLAFLSRVQADLKPDEIVVGLDPETVSFPSNAGLPQNARIVDTAGLSSDNNAEGYLHVKAILIEAGGERYLVSGSANPTFAAWLAPPENRNAEMMVVRRLEAEDGDLGLAALSGRSPISVSSLSVETRRAEPADASAGAPGPLLARAVDGAIVVEGAPQGVLSATLILDDGKTQPAEFEYDDSTLVLSGAKASEAILFGVSLGETDRYGWIHHAESLRQLALSSSQRQIRDGLGDALTGDPTALERLMKLVEKAIFRDASIDLENGRSGPRKRADEGAGENEGGESSVSIVATLRTPSGEELRRLSSGYLGLLLDLLMRQLWRSLTHERRVEKPSEGELPGSEDEDLVVELPVEPRVAEAWRKKTATLLRRLMRLVREGQEPAQTVVQCAAVLGVLEAVRRVEEQDEWRRIHAQFVDRDIAKKFILEAAPALLRESDGVIDHGVSQAGEDFAEGAALVRWLIWLCWLVGFGPAELRSLIAKSSDDSVGIHGLAVAGLVRSRVNGWAFSERQILEMLEAAPRPGVQADSWLAEFRHVGELMRESARARRLERPPIAGDLVVAASLPGAPVFFVAEASPKNVRLIDFTREDARWVIRADRVEVLDPGPIAEGRALARDGAAPPSSRGRD